MMLKSFSLTLFLACSMSLNAQWKIIPKSVSAGYFAPYAIDPGVSLGAHFDLTNPKTQKALILPNPSSFFLNGSVAYFFKNRFYHNTLVNAEIGWRRQRYQKKSYSAFSIGTAYMLRWEALTIYTNFKGEIDITEWERRHFFMPNLSYEFGRRINRQFTWYGKLTYGSAISSKHENSGTLFVGAGMKYFLNKN